jgi:hypothetical protein
MRTERKTGREGNMKSYYQKAETIIDLANICLIITICSLEKIEHLSSFLVNKIAVILQKSRKVGKDVFFN